MKTIDVLLIYPPYSYPKKSPPIGLCYIAAVLEKGNYTVKIIDMSVLEMNYTDLENNIKQLNPKIVGISFMTNQFCNAVNVSKVIKKVNKNIKVLVGGPHVSALPTEILGIDSVDISVIGEGEITTLNVVDYFLKGIGDGLKDIKGIAYKTGKETQQTQMQELIQNIDTLPFPAWHLLPLDQYSVPSTGGNENERVFAIMSSRGCPGRCIFCDSHTIFGNRFRGRTAKNIFNELIYLKENYGATQFDFVDDTITVDKKRLNELCYLIQDSGQDIKWMCNSRVSTVDFEMLSIMKKSGCVRIEFGIESGDENVLKRLKKGITIQQIITAHKNAHDIGLNVGSFVMVGNIGEDFESIMKTKALLQDLETQDIYIAIATPFPGTELYRIAQKNNWINVSDWSKYVTSPTYQSDYKPIMKTDKMEPDNILQAFFYLHSQFVEKKIRTRYGKYFIFNKKFYQDYILNARSWADIIYKFKLVKELFVNFIKYRKGFVVK